VGHASGFGNQDPVPLDTNPQGAAAVPELDAKSGVSAIALMLAGLLVMTGRRRQLAVE
jgi:hypothetical protein